MDRFEHYGWPFFDESHRTLAAQAEDWSLKSVSGQGEDADAVCRKFVKELGKAAG